MSFSIKLCRTDSSPEELDKKITVLSTLSGVLKNETSIIDPVIIIEGNLTDFRLCNYAEIDSFKRKYFVNNIRSIKNGLIEISCHVDVLTSFKNEIRKNRAIINRSQGNYNLYLNDGSLKVEHNPKISTKAFPNGFITSIEFVLAVAGSSGN